MIYFFKISQEIAPTCTVNQLVGKCDYLDITSCSEGEWNGQATVTFATELTSISGSSGWIFETSNIIFSPVNINARYANRSLLSETLEMIYYI